MAKKVIKYKLTSDGKIPSYVDAENSGCYPSAPTWEEMELIGISLNNVELPPDVLVYETVQDLVTYLNTLPYEFNTEKDPMTVEQRTEEIFDRLIVREE